MVAGSDCQEVRQLRGWICHVPGRGLFLPGFGSTFSRALATRPQIQLVTIHNPTSCLRTAVVGRNSSAPLGSDDDKMPSPAPGASDALQALLAPVRRPSNYFWRGLRAAGYPLQGIWYFLRRPAFYPLFVGRLLPLSIISLLVYFVLFTFAFLPQFAFLALFHGWGAWVNAVVLVLGEGLVLIQVWKKEPVTCSSLSREDVRN